MSTAAALGSGLAGACAVTALHETLRRVVTDAPRMDVLGERALLALAHAGGCEPPRGDSLRAAALAGDLAANGAYYSLVGAGDPGGALARGALLGLAAGLGAVFLPGPLGLGSGPSNRTPQTQLMTVGLYLLGGLAAAAAYRCLTAND